MIKPTAQDDFSGMSFQEVGNALAEKTFQELAQMQSKDKHPVQDSRVWKDSKGYQYLGAWQNAALLRVLVRKFTETLPLFPTLKSPLNQTLNQPLKSEHRLIAQMNDEARSTKRNIEEGFKRPTTMEYLTFLGYSQASLEELRGDIRDCKTDGLLKSILGSSLKGININLRVIKGPNRSRGETWGEPTDPGHPYYQPLTTINPQALTYEIFMELINKTDYLLRALVQSLENKLNQEQKFYQIEKARIRGNIRGQR